MPIALSVALLMAGGCSKSETSGVTPPASAVPTAVPTIAITGTPPAPASASAEPSASAVASASASATATARPPASAKLPASAAVVASAPKPEATPLKAASARFSGKNFTLDVASPGCRVDTPCAVTLRLVAAGDFHVNKEYPYKFTASAAPSLQFLGNGDANVFSRAAGDFREDSEKAATMTVRFKPAAAGEARVSGSYKMSVCSAEQCQVETQAVQLAVPVM